MAASRVLSREAVASCLHKQTFVYSSPMCRNLYSKVSPAVEDSSVQAVQQLPALPCLVLHLRAADSSAQAVQRPLAPPFLVLHQPVEDCSGMRQLPALVHQARCRLKLGDVLLQPCLAPPYQPRQVQACRHWVALPCKPHQLLFRHRLQPSCLVGHLVPLSSVHHQALLLVHLRVRCLVHLIRRHQLRRPQGFSVLHHHLQIRCLATHSQQPSQVNQLLPWALQALPPLFSPRPHLLLLQPCHQSQQAHHQHLPRCFRPFSRRCRRRVL